MRSLGHDRGGHGRRAGRVPALWPRADVRVDRWANAIARICDRGGRFARDRELVSILGAQVSRAREADDAPANRHRAYRDGYSALAVLVLGPIVGIPALMLTALVALLVYVRQRRAAPWLVPAARFIFVLSPWEHGRGLHHRRAGEPRQNRRDGIGRPRSLVLGLRRLCGVFHHHLLESRPARDVARDRGMHAVSTASGDTAASRGLACCHVCFKVAPETLHRCPRCGAALHLRKPDSLQRTIALVLTATLLYIPANVLPIMTTTQLGRATDSTILGGVIILMHHGDLPIALVIFVASVLVPISKLLALSWLCWSVTYGDATSQHERARLYRATESLGNGR